MSHKSLWLLTIAIIVVAAAVLSAREPNESSRARELSAAHADSLAQQLFTLLENDPRVRRTRTQRVVEAMAPLAKEPGTNSVETRYALGLQLYYRDRDAPSAEAAFRDVIALRPEWSWPHNNLGIVLFSLGRETEALASFDQAMKLDPTWSRPHSDLAILYRLDERMELALEQVLTALEMDPEGAVTHYNYGVILDVMKRDGEALAQYERVIELDATLPAPHYNIACGYAREGDLESALPYLKEAIRLEEKFRKECRIDSDFDRVRHEPELIAILGPDPVKDSQETMSL